MGKTSKKERVIAKIATPKRATADGNASEEDPGTQ
jgi:hypothetical protein